MSEEETNQELSTDEMKDISGSAPHETTWGNAQNKKNGDVGLGPISGEGVFKPSGVGSAALGPLGGDGVFKPSANQRGSVIVDDNHFRESGKKGDS